ncbi:MAG TPA: hypothetical protein VEH04_08855 [Verrucomicrobiae bacterium]|nr:hypothetical protein [Verrucomicrobiae bacterium]
MKKLILIAGLLTAGVAVSQAGVHLNIGIGFPPPPRVIVSHPAPVYCPPPVVVAPPAWTPVVVAPHWHGGYHGRVHHRHGHSHGKYRYKEHGGHGHGHGHGRYVYRERGRW